LSEPNCVGGVAAAQVGVSGIKYPYPKRYKKTVNSYMTDPEIIAHFWQCGLK